MNMKFVYIVNLDVNEEMMILDITSRSDNDNNIIVNLSLKVLNTYRFEEIDMINF